MSGSHHSHVIPRPVRMLLFAALPLIIDCGGSFPGVGGLPGGCPADINDAAAIMQANFGLEGEMEGKVKAALAAGANLKKVATSVEADVALACGNLAKDLGASDADLEPDDKGPGKRAEKACNLAAKLIGDFKAKVSGKISIDAEPPKCEASMEAAAQCAAECDVNVEPGSAEVQCEGGEISGKCSGECQGSCTVEAGAECSGSCTGSCSGSCTAGFTGQCGGKCDGKCDGKNVSGSCSGTCEGKCSAQAEGSCTGKCEGSCSAQCEIQGQAQCSGSCSGGCSVELEAPKCSGEIKPPEMSAECEANCDAKLNAELECQPAKLKVVIKGAADAEAASRLKLALQNNLPAILKVTMGMTARLEELTASVKTTLEGVKAAVSGGGDAAMKVGACLAGSLKAQAQATASINVSVKASASASASAGAG